MSELPQILLGEDQVLIAEALKLVLANDFEMLGIALDGRELVRETVCLKPDAVVLDISMPNLNGFEAGLQIRERVPASDV